MVSYGIVAAIALVVTKKVLVLMVMVVGLLLLVLPCFVRSGTAIKLQYSILQSEEGAAIVFSTGHEAQLFNSLPETESDAMLTTCNDVDGLGSGFWAQGFFQGFL